MRSQQTAIQVTLIPLMRACTHDTHSIQRQLGVFDGNCCTEILMVDSSWQYMANTAHSQTYRSHPLTSHMTDVSKVS